MQYIIIGLIVVVGFIFFLSSCKKKSAKSDKTMNQETENPKARETKENAFEGLRKMAFSVTPEQLQLNLLSDKTTVFGVVMDWEMGGTVATTVAYLTGDASLYLSSGGGVIGGGQHQNVNNAAKQFVQLSQVYLEKATKTETTPLPETDIVKFYFLTNKGVFVRQEQMKNFENHSSAWYQLFEEGNKVLSELRLTTK